MTCWHYFFYYFLKRHLDKILGNTLIMPHYWHFWKPSPHFCKESRVPTKLVVLSLPFIIIPFIYPVFKMRHLHGKLQQLISKSKLVVPVSTTQENEIILTYLGTTFGTLLIKKILHLLQSSLIWKMLILYILFLLINYFYSDFCKTNFCILQ